MPPLAPAASEDGSSGLGSHSHAKAMGPAASASIRLKRSFHFVMTPDSRRCGPTSRGARPTLNSRRSETKHPTPPSSLCQPDYPAPTPSSSSAPTRASENFFLSAPTPYARLPPSSGRHKTKRFPTRWGPSQCGFSTFVDIPVEIVSRSGARLLGVVVVDLA
jgi:hypothetical protein